MARKKISPTHGAAQPTLLLELPLPEVRHVPSAPSPSLPGPVATGHPVMHQVEASVASSGEVVLIHLASKEVAGGFSASGSMVRVGSETEGGEVLEECSEEAEMRSRTWAESEVIRRLLSALEPAPREVVISTRTTEVVGHLVANLPSWGRANFFDPDNAESHLSLEAKKFWGGVLETLTLHRAKINWIAPNPRQA